MCVDPSPLRSWLLVDPNPNPNPHAKFWILQPFSGYDQWQYTWEDQCWSIHPQVHTSVILIHPHIYSDGKKSSLCRLNISTISSISIHRCSACGISSDRSFGWLLHHNALHNPSNLHLDIPVVIPSFRAGIYLLMDTRLHSEALDVNSNRVINIIIPSSL